MLLPLSHAGIQTNLTYKTCNVKLLLQVLTYLGACNYFPIYQSISFDIMFNLIWRIMRVNINLFSTGKIKTRSCFHILFSFIFLTRIKESIIPKLFWKSIDDIINTSSRVTFKSKIQQSLTNHKPAVALAMKIDHQDLNKVCWTTIIRFSGK